MLIRGENTFQYERWQDEAWAMYENLGEFRRGVTWKAEVVSRGRLIAAYAPDRQGDEPTPIPEDSDDPAIDLVNKIAGGIGGQSELLRSMTIHLDVPGEGWFVGDVESSDMDLQDEEELLRETIAWTVYSADDLRYRDGRYHVRLGSSSWKPLPDTSVPVRIWRPHERHHWMADSPAHGALPIMRRLELLNRHVDAQALSRLASNGVYWISTEIEFPASERYPDADDPFIAQFMENGITAIKTPGSAAAAFPIVNRAPFQYIKDGIRYDTFSSPFDQKVLELREFEVQRLATSMDVPPEVLLGMKGVSHWGAWQIEESALKTTVASTLELICWGLTHNYLEPGLAAGRRLYDQTSDDGRRRIIWYDTSELSVRPDRSQDAIKLGGDLTITDDAIIRETGFDNADLLKVDSPEFKERVGKMLVSTGVPASVSIGLALLGLAQLPETAGVDVVGDETVPITLPNQTPPSRQPSGNGDRPGTPATRDDPIRTDNPRPVRASANGSKAR